MTLPRLAQLKTNRPARATHTHTRSRARLRKDPWFLVLRALRCTMHDRIQDQLAQKARKKMTAQGVWTTKRRTETETTAGWCVHAANQPTYCTCHAEAKLVRSVCAPVVDSSPTETRSWVLRLCPPQNQDPGEELPTIPEEAVTRDCNHEPVFAFHQFG